MKPTLADLQKGFLAYFYHTDNMPVFTQHLQQNTAFSPAARLDIYKGSIIGSLTKHLRDVFEVCEKIVGEDFFYGLAHTFIEQYPSASPDLGDYGEAFADFVETFPPAKGLPYLADMCRLCWAWHLAYRSKAEPSFDIRTFAKLSDEVLDDVVFLLPQSAQLVTSCYPIDRIWRMCHEAQSEEIVLDGVDVYLFIWRDEKAVNVDTMTQAEWTLATLLTAQQPLSHIQESLAQAELDMAALLPTFLSKRWLAGWTQ